MFKKRGTVKHMNCNEVIFRLSPYQDDELAAQTKIEVQAHLAQCGNCRFEYQRLEKIQRGIAALREVEPAQNFTSSVMSRIKAKEKRRWFALPAMTYASIFIVFFILGVLLTMNSKNGTTPVRQEAYVSDILIDAQDLSLINIQEKTFAMLYDGGKSHGK
jgi:predicted anti-sigma-YlaC factor YlaD